MDEGVKEIGIKPQEYDAASLADFLEGLSSRALSDLSRVGDRVPPHGGWDVQRAVHVEETGGARRRSPGSGSRHPLSHTFLVVHEDGPEPLRVEEDGVVVRIRQEHALSLQRGEVLQSSVESQHSGAVGHGCKRLCQPTLVLAQLSELLRHFERREGGIQLVRAPQERLLPLFELRVWESLNFHELPDASFHESSVAHDGRYGLGVKSRGHQVLCRHLRPQHTDASLRI